jgi:hypothetical protein
MSRPLRRILQVELISIPDLTMTIDRYTKTVLTIIAASLVWIGAQLTTVPLAEATSQSRAEIQQVNVVEVGGIPVGGRSERTGQAGALPVRVIP